MELKRVVFEFDDATQVTFRQHTERWSAEVTTIQDRADPRRSGEYFANEWLRPTVRVARELVEAAKRRRRRVARHALASPPKADQSPDDLEELFNVPTNRDFIQRGR